MVSSCTDVGMARLHSTLSTVAHRSPMLLADSVSGQPRSNWWWCHDIGYPLLAAEHSLCTAPWSGTPCRMTSAHSRTMSPLGRAWKPGFSLDASVFSALDFVTMRCINSHLSYHNITMCSTKSRLRVSFTKNIHQLSLAAMPLPSKCLPTLLCVNWSGYDLDLWPLTLKTFVAIPTHVMNICGKFHCSPSTQQSRTAEQTTIKHSAFYWWQRHNTWQPVWHVDIFGDLFYCQLFCCLHFEMKM